MYKIIIGLVGALLLSGCATSANYQQQLMQWHGARAQDLVNAWGYPEASIKMPNGDTVYMYSRKQSYTQPSYPTPTFTVTGAPIYGIGYNQMYGGQTISLTCRTWFEFNAQGIIVDTRFEGNGCIASNVHRWQPSS